MESVPSMFIGSCNSVMGQSLGFVLQNALSASPVFSVKKLKKAGTIVLPSTLRIIPLVNILLIMVYIWFIYMVIIWLMMVNNNLVGGIPTPLKNMS